MVVDATKSISKVPNSKKVKKFTEVLLGKVSDTLKMGLVGLPNVGKSSTYNLLSRMHVPAKAANYPFCTIDPNEVKVTIHNDRLDGLCKIYKPKKRTSAYLDITDIAGLVKGASTGKGMGNKFLSHINGVDGIYHVVRAFED